MTNELTWNRLLREQINSQLRDRLRGLTNAEYFWEPAPASWSVRPRGTSTAPIQAGSGAMTIDFAFPEPDPPPVTTIAWRLGHVIVGVLAMRNASHFGREAIDYETFEYAETADEALAQLDAEYATWLKGVESLGGADLAKHVGDTEPGHENSPYAELVLHINREVIHHLAEVCLLRDLYTHTRKGTE